MSGTVSRPTTELLSLGAPAGANTEQQKLSTSTPCAFTGEMPAGGEGGGKDELKTQFTTREGTYRVLSLSEYSRPNRVGYSSSQSNSPVKVSFVSLSDAAGTEDRICFNVGRELYVYMYRGVKKVLPAAFSSCT